MKAFPILLSLVLALNVAADCSQWPATSSAPFRTTALDLSPDGNFLWMATGYGVQLLENGTVVDSIALPSTTRTIHASGNGLAYAGSGSTVYVLRRDNRTITTVTSVAAGSTVNDLEIVGAALFAATNNGIAHYDLLNASAPVRTSVTLPTTTPIVTSLATAKSKLYAADGDGTVEIYSMAIPLLPQHVGTLASAPRATAVHATANDEVFISDRFGSTTDVYSGTTLLARVPTVTTAFAASTGKRHFLAGTDRIVRAVDFTTPSRIAEVFAAQLAPTPGTVNTIQAMALIGNTLYIAAGDIGLVTLDTTTIARPYAQVTYPNSVPTSVRTSTDKAWFSNIAGRITQYRVDPTAIALIEERAWDTEVGSVVRDYRDNGLLTTSGNKATVWSLVSTLPVTAETIDFGGAIEDAVRSDTHVIAMLADGTILAAPHGTATPALVNVPVMTQLARSGSAIALVEVREEDEKTVLHYYATGNLAAPTRQYTIDGAATGGIALDATRAAIFTFNGINVIDLASGNVRVIADSNAVIPREMAFASDDLLVMDSRRLLVYDDARTLIRDHELPAEALGMDVASNVTAIATAGGTTALRHGATQPELSTPFSNRYYTKLAAAKDRAYLFDDDGIDVLSTVFPDRPQFIGTIPAAGTIDLVATDAGVFTLSGSGNVTAYSRAGEQIAQVNIRDGFDSQALSIRTARGAIWASLALGCTFQSCRERKTLVLDPNTLAVTATMTGSITDVAVSGTRAYALVAFPDEIRVLNVADAQHPAEILKTTAPAFASSIAYAPNKIYVLAGKVFGYSESTLTQNEERLTTVTPNASQRIRIEGTCALVGRDAFAPVLYDLPSWTPSTRQFALPSPLKSFLSAPSMLWFLTDHSLELAHPATTAHPRRRAAGR